MNDTSLNARKKRVAAGFLVSRNGKGEKVTDREKKQYEDTPGLEVRNTCNTVFAHVVML